MPFLRHRSKRTPYRPHSQSGAAMLEFAIIIPLFVLIMAGIVDLGRGLEQYFALRRLAYESGRMASNTEQLERGRYSPDESDGQSASVHNALHGKIRAMIDFHGTKRFPEHVWMETERFADSPRLLRVTLTTTVKPMLVSFFPPITISATVDAPYLFTE